MYESQLASYEADGTPKLFAMGVRDRAEPRDSPLYQRGELDQPGEIVPRGLVQVLSRKHAHDRSRKRPARAGRVAGLAREPADGPRDGQPGLAAPVRPRPGADARQLRRRRPAAQPSRAARPPGRLVHGERLVDQGADPPDRAQPGLPARLPVRCPEQRGRPRQRAGLADEQAPARGRGRARRHARDQRPARPARSPRARSSPARARVCQPRAAGRASPRPRATTVRSTCR